MICEAGCMPLFKGVWPAFLVGVFGVWLFVGVGRGLLLLVVKLYHCHNNGWKSHNKL